MIQAFHGLCVDGPLIGQQVVHSSTTYLVVLSEPLAGYAHPSDPRPYVRPSMEEVSYHWHPVAYGGSYQLSRGWRQSELVELPNLCIWSTTPNLSMYDAIRKLFELNEHHMRNAK